MTIVKISKDGNRVRAEIAGHAGYSKRGNDIVCSAASMMASTLAQHVQKMAVSGQIERIGEFIYKPERFYVEFDTGAGSENAAAVDVMLDVIVTGYELLAEMYPDHVQIGLDY